MYAQEGAVSFLRRYLFVLSFFFVVVIFLPMWCLRDNNVRAVPASSKSRRRMDVLSSCSTDNRSTQWTRLLVMETYTCPNAPTNSTAQIQLKSIIHEKKKGLDFMPSQMVATKNPCHSKENVLSEQ
jgi:hypothetical protein